MKTTFAALIGGRKKGSASLESHLRERNASAGKVLFEPERFALEELEKGGSASLFVITGAGPFRPKRFPPEG